MCKQRKSFMQIYSWSSMRNLPRIRQLYLNFNKMAISASLTDSLVYEHAPAWFEAGLHKLQRHN